MFAYTLWMHRRKLVICSNTWSQELKRLPDEDAEWIRKNSIHLIQHKPMYKKVHQ